MLNGIVFMIAADGGLIICAWDTTNSPDNGSRQKDRIKLPVGSVLLRNNVPKVLIFLNDKGNRDSVGTKDLATRMGNCNIVFRKKPNTA